VYLRLGVRPDRELGQAAIVGCGARRERGACHMEERREIQDIELIEHVPVERPAALLAPPLRIARRRPVTRSAYLAL